jgi:hypothetical protein
MEPVRRIPYESAAGLPGELGHPVVSTRIDLIVDGEPVSAAAGEGAAGRTAGVGRRGSRVFATARQRHERAAHDARHMPASRLLIGEGVSGTGRCRRSGEGHGNGQESEPPSHPVRSLACECARSSTIAVEPARSEIPGRSKVARAPPPSQKRWQSLTSTGNPTASDSFAPEIPSSTATAAIFARHTAWPLSPRPISSRRRGLTGEHATISSSPRIMMTKPCWARLPTLLPFAPMTRAGPPHR